MSKYKLVIDEKQLNIISLALDIYSRLEGGQLDWVFSMLHWKHYDNLSAAKPLLAELKQLLTGMQVGSLGISQVSNDAKIAYDIHHVIRHHLAWEYAPNGGNTIGFDEPTKWSDEPLASLERV